MSLSMFLSTKDQHNTFEIPTPTMTSINLAGVAQSFLLVPTNLIQYAAVISSLDLVFIRVQNQISVLKYINLNALCFVCLPTVNNEHRAESHSSMAVVECYMFCSCSQCLNTVCLYLILKYTKAYLLSAVYM